MAPGNTCVVGYFSGTSDFDPGPATYELTGGGTFAAKYDPSGNLLWAQRVGAGNSSFNFGPEIAAGTDGSVYVVGTFRDSANLWRNDAHSAGDDDAFVVKLDAAGGTSSGPIALAARSDWATMWPSTRRATSTSMAETRRRIETGNPDAFIAKMDAARQTSLWSRKSGPAARCTTKGKAHHHGLGPRLQDHSRCGLGDVYATGRMSGTVDFDAGAGNTALSGIGFVYEALHERQPRLALAFTGGTVEAHDIAVDASGNVYTTGIVPEHVDFDPGTANSQKFNLSSTYYGAYVARSTRAATSVGHREQAAPARRTTPGLRRLPSVVRATSTRQGISWDGRF